MRAIKSVLLRFLDKNDYETRHSGSQQKSQSDPSTLMLCLSHCFIDEGYYSFSWMKDPWFTWSFNERKSLTRTPPVL